MRSIDGRWVLTFNGEIYNYPELRSELASLGYQFRSQTDTEVLLAALLTWGPEAIHRLNGVFAFALWDDEQGQLLLARDRLGVKPLYYSIAGPSICFGSEIAAILASGLVDPEIDRESLNQYLRLLWVVEPRTLFSNIVKVPPGHTLSWDGERARLNCYWDVPKPESQDGADPAIASRALSTALQGAVRRQMRADVPVGIFLSGGVDSTAILHFAAAAGDASLRAYSIGLSPTRRSEEGALDDVRYARIVAQAYGVPHQVITLEPNVAELLPKMVRHLEDPVADPAAINCYLICEAARETSTVLLSGTGADELFGGYRKYAAAWLGSRYQRLPGRLREWVIEPLSQRLPVALGKIELRHVRMAKKFLGFAGATEFERFLGYSSYYDGAELAELLGKSGTGQSTPYLGAMDLRNAWEQRGTDQVIDRMTYVDLKYYLPGLGLAYMDKASMAASVEVRVPLVDDAIVDMIARLPDEYKVRGLRTKVLLRAALRGKIPDVILSRPKAPFAAPIRSWLRGDLVGMVKEYLDPAQIARRGLLDPKVVGRMIREHERGWQDHSLRIWALLTLEIWMQEFLDSRARFALPEGMAEPEMLGAGMGA